MVNQPYGIRVKKNYYTITILCFYYIYNIVNGSKRDKKRFKERFKCLKYALQACPTLWKSDKTAKSPIKSVI